MKVAPRPDALIPLHGGYRKLKSFQVAQLAYDVTVRFCDRYVENAAARMTKWCKRRGRACRTLRRAARQAALPRKPNSSSPTSRGRAWRNCGWTMKIFCGSGASPNGRAKTRGGRN